MNNEKIIHDTTIFCNNIRQRHRLSKRKMAKLLQIGVPTLDKIEQGILPHCVRASTLFQILDIFGLTAEEMFRPLDE